ncbi:MAG TPA: cytochrome c3 family protein [Anaerolineae bacterium]
MLKRFLRAWLSWRLWIGVIIVLPVLAVASSAGIHQIEQQDGFCISCHTQPETNYQARFDSALATNQATDLAAFHHKKLNDDKVNVRCIDCHSGEGPAGRAIVVTLAAWDAAKHYTGTARQPAQVVFTLQNEACEKCHQDAVRKEGFENHFHNKLYEPGAAYERCVDCHVSHQQGTEANNFQFRGAIIATCQDCHRQEKKGPINMGAKN